MERITNSASASNLPCDLGQVNFHFSPSVFPPAKWDQPCLMSVSVGCLGDKIEGVCESTWKSRKPVLNGCSVRVSTSRGWNEVSVGQCPTEHPGQSWGSNQAWWAQCLPPVDIPSALCNCAAFSFLSVANLSEVQAGPDPFFGWGQEE